MKNLLKVVTPTLAILIPPCCNCRCHCCQIVTLHFNSGFLSNKQERNVVFDSWLELGPWGAKRKGYRKRERTWTNRRESRMQKRRLQLSLPAFTQIPWRTVPPPRLPHIHHQIKHTRSAVSFLGQNSHFPPPAKNAMSQLLTDSSAFQLTLGHAWLLPEWQSDSGLCQRTCQPPGYGPVPQPTRWACFNYSTSNTNHPCTDK